MSKWRVVFLLFLSQLMLAQTKTTVTGVVQDSTGVLATSGTVVFTLQPQNNGIIYFVTGTGILAPQIGTCGIDASGNIKSLANLSNPCQVWGTDIIQPANLTYQVSFFPNGNFSNVVGQQCITGTTYDLSNPKFCPVIRPTPQGATVITSPIQNNLIPSADAVFALGSASMRYANVFAANGTFTNLNLINNLTVPGLTILNGGTFNGTYGGNPTLSGNVAVGGTLGVTGNSTLTGLLATSGISSTKRLRDCGLPGPLGDGLVADGVTNDRVALNNCLANAFANGQNVQLPSGKIHISGGAINDTNKPGMNITGVQANETYSRDVATQDYGTGITQIMCDTGVVCWDMTGSGGQEIKHTALRIASSYATPSTVGFLLGRDNAVSNGSSSGSGTYCFSANDVLNNVWVFADSIPAATALGTVAVYNMGAETFTILGGGYLANEGIMFGTSNVLSISSPFQTLGTGCPSSMTEVRINGSNIEAWTGNSIRFDDQIIDFETDASTEFLNLSPGTNHNATINFNAPTFQNNIFLRGQVENFDFPVAISKNLDRAYINLMVGGNLAGHGLIQWATTNLGISNSNISFEFDNGTAVPLLDNVAAGSSIKGSIINEAGLTGSGANASSTTVSTSTIYADGLTDANVNTFQAGSTYDLFDASGRSVIGPLTVTGTLGSAANSVALTADWTCGTGGTVASCVSATIVGSGGGVPLTFTLPSVAASWTWECDGVVGQATAATANQWNILTATNGATNVTASYSMATAATASAYGAVTDQASTTTTFQISPSWTLGGTATKMPFHIWGRVEGASASGTVLSLQLVAPTVGDLVTIYRGTSCRIR